MEDTINSTDVLEWSLVLRELSKKASSELGKEYCLNLPIAQTFEEANILLNKTDEAYELLNKEGSIPLGGLRNITKALEELSLGAVLQGTTFLDISSTLRSVRVLKKFLTSKLKEENELYKMVFPLYTNEDLEREIEISFASDGSVNDIASKELARIRASIRQIQQNLRDRLNKLMQDSKYKGALQENYITQRNGRYVIPVKAESQSSIKGIVQDQSQSGSTVYLEPLAIVDDNNKLAKKLLEEKNEIEKILLEFGYKILPDISLLLDAVSNMAEIDSIIARANYAISIDGHKPILNNYGFVNINRVKHPVLIAQKGLENVVPINISLGKIFDTMIITGSNTGGKTVTLKTLGLCSIMAKSGMFFSSGLDSEIAFFDKILADIGDEQSLEQNLSTFSGHLNNINKIMQNADKSSLVLLDEAGTGTDPTEGTAIAQAIIEKLRDSGAKTVVTTHYSELKTLAYKYPNVTNASVEFNAETLSPTYRLLLGVPGKSNALHIARKLNFDSDVIARAKELLKSDNKGVSLSVEQLEKEYKRVADERSRIEEVSKSLKEKEEIYTKQIEELEQKKKKFKSELYEVFKAEMDLSIQEVKDVVRELQTGKTSQNAEKARKKLEDISKNVKGKFKKEDKVIVDKEQIEIKNGEYYYLEKLQQVVQVISEPKDTKVQVQAGLLKITADISELSKVEQKELKKRVKHLKHQGTGTNVIQAPVTRSSSEDSNYRNSFNECDLRGLYVDEAIPKASKFLDEASLNGASPVYIIHGRGSGALKSAVRDLLSSLKYIKSYRAGEYYEGGDGISVVYLR